MTTEPEEATENRGTAGDTKRSDAERKDLRREPECQFGRTDAAVAGVVGQPLEVAVPGDSEVCDLA